MVWRLLVNRQSRMSHKTAIGWCPKLEISLNHRHEGGWTEFLSRFLPESEDRY